jgi:putative acetyltransferase
MDLLIRPVRVEDLPAIHEMRLQPQVLRHTRALPSERADDWMARLGPLDHVFVAELDGRVVGLAGLHGKEGKKRHVGTVGLMVHDAFAGRGVGARLLGKVLDLADNWLGLARVELDAMADNERALRLYRKLGFVEEGRQQKAYYREGAFVDAILMARLR